MVPSVLLSSVNRETAEEDECCHVIKLEAFPVFDNTELSWRFSATMSSPYKQETGWDKYFDAFEIRTSLDGGEVLTTRILAHPHPTDQPFTRSTNDTVSLPKGVTIVVAVARDSVSGFCGSGVSLELPTTDDPEALTESASSVATHKHTVVYFASRVHRSICWRFHASDTSGLHRKSQFPPSAHWQYY
jgi:hypothetical protein